MNWHEDNFIHQRYLSNFELFVQWSFEVNINRQEVGADFQSGFSFVVKENSKMRRNQLEKEIMFFSCINKAPVSYPLMMVSSKSPMWHFWPLSAFFFFGSWVICLVGKIGNSSWACLAQLCPTCLTWSSTTWSGCMFISSLFGFHAKLCPLIKPLSIKRWYFGLLCHFMALYTLNCTQTGALWCCLLESKCVTHGKPSQTFCIGLRASPMCLHSSVYFPLNSS